KVPPADQPPVDELNLEMLEQLALVQNPALRQAAATVRQVRGVHQQVGLKPNPTVGYFGQEIGNDGSGGQHGGYVSQTWVRGQKLAWNRRVVAHELSATQWQARVQRQRILTDLRIAYYDALSAQLRLRLAEDFRVVAEKAVELATEKLEAQVGTRPDLLQSEIQLSEIDLVIQRAKIEQSAALRQLAALCGVAGFGDAKVIGDFEGSGHLSGSSAADEEAALADLLASSPELAVARANVDRECANLQRQKRQPVPNLTTQLGVGADDATGSAFTNVQMSLPIPVTNSNQGNIRAAGAAYSAAIQDVERIEARLQSDLARVFGEYRGAKAVVENFRDQILPKAQAALELLQAGKEAGEFDFLRVLTARRMYFDSNLQFVSAQAELAQAEARIHGKLLAGGLNDGVRYSGEDSLRGQALGGQ
ncbi:MAG TPA: TolC family protein, partial [Planctomycetaceae bacterium]|nr:TolC family protein [Planctomycetaceae bacterium]